MKDEFDLLSVNSEPVLYGVSSGGGRLCFMRDIWLLQDNLQGGQNVDCLANVNLQLAVTKVQLYLGHTKRQFIQRFTFFQELKESIRTEWANNYTQVCCVEGC
jgi:hypothetical protein